MIDYQIEENTRRCAATGRVLQPGERFYSVLSDEGGKFLRKDYGSDVWQGPPPESFSFWTGRVPPPGKKRRPHFDDELLFECYQRLQGHTDPARVNFRYVLALLLLRRKRLKFEEARMEDAQEMLCLRCLRTQTLFQVVNPRLTEEEMATVQEEVFKVLGWE